MKKYYVLAGLAVVCGAAGVIYKWQHTEREAVLSQLLPQAHTTVRPHSFAECVAQGFPVQETEPRRCQAGAIAFVDVFVDSNRDALAVPVQLDNIAPQSLVVSPLTVRGTAPGAWFFEANIGLRVLDAQGGEVARGHAQADADWMTDQPVHFTGIIDFNLPATQLGYIEIQKDNPSDNRELDASVRVPVRFK